MNISLPSDMKAWVEQQVRDGGFGTASEYFRQLLRAEQQRRVRQQIDDNLLESLDSGPATPMTDADWQRIREAGRKRLSRKRKKAP